MTSARGAQPAAAAAGCSLAAGRVIAKQLPTPASTVSVPSKLCSTRWRAIERPSPVPRVDGAAAYRVRDRRPCAPTPRPWPDAADPRLAQLPPGIAVDRTFGDAVRGSRCTRDLRRNEGLRRGVGGLLEPPGVDR